MNEKVIDEKEKKKKKKSDLYETVYDKKGCKKFPELYANVYNF